MVSIIFLFLYHFLLRLIFNLKRRETEYKPETNPVFVICA